MNKTLERDNAGYRFVNNELTPITAPQEVETIETALEKSTRTVREHLGTALTMLSDRKNPDYRNSIKESISAVESACQAFTGMPKATLSDCLATMRKAKAIHPAFEQALAKLYGYAGDAGGIRHALTD